jgi:hypothetical protein
MSKSYLLTVCVVLIMQCACVTDNEIMTNDDKSTKELALTLGYPNCRLSGPLQIDDVFRYARFEGIHVDSPMALQQQISENMKLGYEIRLIDCTKVIHRLIEGSKFIAAIHGGEIKQQWLDVTVN